MGVFAIQVSASTGGGEESLSVSAAWIKGDTLHIEVADTKTGDSSTLEIDIRQLAADKETITIQAVDFEGNQSNTIQIKNPYYPKDAPDEQLTDTEKKEEKQPEQDNDSRLNPFTPDGAATVIDNATGHDEKEFFTIRTDNDNTFYLIVDRQRNADNVYLLNAVTEKDLTALAEKDGSGAIPTPVPQPEITPEPPEPETKPPEEPIEPPKKESAGGGWLIIILVGLLVGGAGYYFKIYKPQKEHTLTSGSFEEDEEDDSLEDEDYFFSDDELGDYEELEAFGKDENTHGDGGDDA